MKNNNDKNIIDNIKTYVFVDASNLFYGGEKSLGWKIDYKKLALYLKEKYNASKIFYFGGVETHGFNYDYLKNDTVPIDKLIKYLDDLIKNKSDSLEDTEILLINRHVKIVRFYKKLKDFKYILFLKPVKTYEQEDGYRKRKANSDADMAFHLMKEKDSYSRAVVLSGDGDFFPVLKYLQNVEGKEIIVFARALRTAKEIKQLAGGNFRDFEYLKYLLQME